MGMGMGMGMDMGLGMDMGMRMDVHDHSCTSSVRACLRMLAHVRTAFDRVIASGSRVYACVCMYAHARACATCMRLHVSACV